MARPDARDQIKLYEEAKSIRSPYEQDWRMAAAYCRARHFAAWNIDGPASVYMNTAAARRYAYDNTGTKSLPKYVAILNRIATPDSQRWHKLSASNTDLMRIYTVRQYFDTLTDKLFKMRYNPRAHFSQTTGELYGSIGLYGMGPNSITWRKPSVLDPRGGFAYKAWHMRDIFVLADDEGNITHVFRRFWLNARQFKRKFPKEVENPPKSIKAELAKSNPDERAFFEFVQILCNREDYDDKAIDARRHPISSDYICVKDNEYVGPNDGFRSMPILTPRTDTDAGDIYGYSAAIQALPALGGASITKKTMLKQGQKAVDPPYLANDDGVLSGRVDIRPGRITPGGITKDGKKLVQRLDMGDFNVAEAILQDERGDIEDSFFVTLFKILEENPEMTATAVVELVAQKASLLAPTMARLQSEQFGPQIEREITLLAENGELPEMPPELIEARGEYQVTYTSPLAKGQYAEEVAGFMRWYEMLLNSAQAMQDPSILDWANMDVAAPEIADHMAVRTAWVRDTKTVEVIRADRAKAQQDQAVMDQAPAIASVVNTAMKQKGTSNAPGVSN